MMNKIEILALCPRILSLNNREIDLFFKSHFINDNHPLENFVYEKRNDWIAIIKSNIKIKIFKSGIIEIKNRSIGQNLIDHLLDYINIAQYISINLFQTEALFDISIFYENEYLIKNSYNLELKQYNSISSTLKDNISYEIKKEDKGYRIIVKGLKKVNETPEIFEKIIKNNLFQFNNS